MNNFIQKTIKIYEKYKWQIWFFTGLAVIFVFLLPYYFLGENAYQMIHDELDDGIFKYVLYARNFGVNSNFIPEFMGGQNRYTITVSSFFGILVYKIFEPLTAFNVMLTVSVLTGYAGVFLLGKEISSNAFASFFAASVFSYLPFRSMFALNIVGFPILIWALVVLARNKGKKTILPFAAVIFYSLGTTLAWGGYMSIGFLSVAIVILSAVKFLAIKKEKIHDGKDEKNLCILNLVISDAILIIIQFITSFDLIVNTFGKNAVLSHREEIIPNSRADVFAHFKEMMYVGGSHSECCSMYIALSGLALLILIPFVMLFLKKKTDIKEMKNKYCMLAVFYAANVLNSLFSCFWLLPSFVAFRERTGGILKTFQLNRIYWIMPACWMCVLILETAILLDLAKVFLADVKFKKMKWLSIIPVMFVMLIAFSYGRNVYLSSNFYHNIRLVFFPDTYHVDTWRDYYAEELFDDIDKAIGRDKSEYKTVSVGINPAVALFNGFYTLDGYSTDYPLEYKHEFRKIIENELAKDEGIRGYFDNWGNRCYIFSSELPISTGLNNPKDEIQNLDIDTRRLKEMGADYIFSGAEIKNAEDLNIYPIKDGPFVRDSYKYRIWVYEIN